MSTQGEEMNLHVQQDMDKHIIKFDKYKIIALFSTILGTLYGVLRDEKGTYVFTITTSVMLIFAIAPPKEISAAARGFDFAALYKRFSDRMRSVFQYGDRLVRACVLFLTFGGTALICKYGILHFSLLPRYADVVYKRLGVDILIVSLVIYPVSILSKRIYSASMRERDQSMRGFELPLYVAASLFSISISIAVLSFPVEGLVPSMHEGGAYELPSVDFGVTLQVLYVAGIWLVWVIGLGACILSRFFEWSWRDKLDQ